MAYIHPAYLANYSKLFDGDQTLARFKPSQKVEPIILQYGLASKQFHKTTIQNVHKVDTHSKAI